MLSIVRKHAHCSHRRGKDDRDNETVQSESLAENEDKDHTNVNIFLSVGSDTSVTDHSNGKTGRKV